MLPTLIPSGDPRGVKRTKMKEKVAMDSTGICNRIYLGCSNQVDRSRAEQQSGHFSQSRTLTVNTIRGCPQEGVHLFCGAC